MKCQKVQSNLIFFIGKELSQEDEEQTKLHLSACDECSMLYRRVNETINFINIERNEKVNPFLFTRINEKIKNSNSREIIPAYYRLAHAFVFALIISAGLAAGILLGTKNAGYFTGLNSKKDKTTETREFTGDFAFNDEEINNNY
ncbi:MAG: hypothetical protein PHD97_06985 [Bacteroidales bacterium]|nr:hypothetical protein [Bacteroidales bacterium]